MAFDNVWNQNWYVENLQRPYPLRYGVSARDTLNRISIPEDLLVQMQIISVGHDPLRYYISQIRYFGSSIAIVISSFSGSASVQVAEFLIPMSAEPFSSFNVAGSFSTSASCTIGELTTIRDWPAGVYDFTFENAALEFDVGRPSVVGVSQFYVKNGDSTVAATQGVVVLTAGSNVKLLTSTTTVGDNRLATLVSVNAAANPAYVKGCECVGQPTTKPITSINGLFPNANGDFTLSAAGAYQFKADANGVSFINAATEPCCGCDQLDAVFQDVREFANAASSLEEFIRKLATGIDRLEFLQSANRDALSGGCS